jgi:hypothetical protein
MIRSLRVQLLLLAVASIADARIVMAQTLIPGGGAARSDCHGEWLSSIPNRGATAIDCQDGDPACDLDRTVNGTCLIAAGICLHMDNVPGCTAPAIREVTVRASPKRLRKDLSVARRQRRPSRSAWRRAAPTLSSRSCSEAIARASRSPRSASRCIWSPSPAARRARTRTDSGCAASRTPVPDAAGRIPPAVPASSGWLRRAPAATSTSAGPAPRRVRDRRQCHRTALPRWLREHDELALHRARSRDDRGQPRCVRRTAPIRRRGCPDLRAQPSREPCAHRVHGRRRDRRGRGHDDARGAGIPHEPRAGAPTLLGFRAW